MSSSVEEMLLATGGGICSVTAGLCCEVAVAQVLSVLSEGVVSERRLNESLLVSRDSSFRRDFTVSD